MSEGSSKRSCKPSQKKKADKLSSRNDSDTEQNEMGKADPKASSNLDIPDCAVCLQSCIHPVQLPCGHVFCFLCMKGASTQNRRCALCRQEIPVDFFNSPKLLTAQELEILAEETHRDEDRYTWFYEGRNGWWQYDERTNVELEESYLNKKRTFELLIAGYVYVIDLDSMLQFRRTDPSRRRRIKRDLVSAPKKGIAGLKIQPREKDAAERQVDGAEEGKSDGAAGGAAQAAATPVNIGAVHSTDSNSQDAAVPLKSEEENTDSAGQEQLDCPNVNHSNSTANETVYEVVRHSSSSSRTNSNEQSPPSYRYNTPVSSNEHSPAYALPSTQRRRQLDTSSTDNIATSEATPTHASQSGSLSAHGTSPDVAIHHQRTHSAPEVRQSTKTSSRPRYPAPPIPPRSQTTQLRSQAQADEVGDEAANSRVSSGEQPPSQSHSSSATTSSTRQRRTRRQVHEV